MPSLNIHVARLVSDTISSKCNVLRSQEIGCLRRPVGDLKNWVVPTRSVAWALAFVKQFVNITIDKTTPATDTDQNVIGDPVR